MLSKQRHSIVLLITVLTGVLLMTGVHSAWAISPAASFIGANYEETYGQGKTIMPVWRKPADIPAGSQYGTDYAASDKGSVFVLQKGKLTAFEAKSGHVRWTFGSGLQLPLYNKDGTIYVASANGYLFAVDASTGRKRWKSSAPSPGLSSITAANGQVLITNGHIRAYDISTGKLQWQDNNYWAASGPLTLTENLVLMASVESGAYTYDILRAYDRKTGKKQWEQARHNTPLIANDKAIVVDRTSTMLEQTKLPTLDTIDPKTGKIIKSVVYNPENLNEDTMEQAFGAKFVLSDGKVFLIADTKVYEYPEEADPAKTKPAIYSLQGSLDYRYAAGPYNGKLLFSNGRGVSAIKTVNNTTISFEGITNPTARFDLLNKGMYLSQTDGYVVAINLRTAKAEVRLQTGSRTFGTPLLESGMIIVQAKGQLIAFREPESLKQ
ncbi:PQQ-binding-like beta-propeller repeat protein [Paenibacillus beijingensis]|uniref:Pyrrolo-quinoline quinone repeat domain-containing protein n=1 Tax=Paenibacillus beijingensis TaxID=1126833 RepID=A0A0D5NGG1_9BACL|nr:PQQ-binding-like beta-propeller repeat protein [Paenibacillus beijingensis]AJY74200.1 hypothetical protein VN24_05950 [Paenibacillus beijingensis]